MELGRRLREARERKGLTLTDIACRTNISLPVLDAIERGDVARVPGGFFIRARLRAFAGQVGLDPEQVLAAYLAEHEPRPVEDELLELRRRYSAPVAGEGRWTPALLLAIGAVILVLFGLLLTQPVGTATADPDSGLSTLGSRLEAPGSRQSPKPVHPFAQWFSRRSATRTT